MSKHVSIFFLPKFFKMSKSKITVNRSSKTGKFVSKKYAAKHKSTTETERYRVTKNKS